MARWRVVGTALASSAVVIACQAFLGLDAPVGIDPPAPDAEPILDHCAHAFAPGAPEPSDAADIAPDVGQWFAIQTYEIPYVDDAGLGAGLDLDQSCTCNPDPLHRDARDGAPSCIEPVGYHTCDPQGGIDDAFGTQVAAYFQTLSQFDPRVNGNADIARGIRTAVAWVGGYNGLENDDSVTVGMVSSVGLLTPDGGCADGGPHPLRDASPNEEGTFYPPLFDGCDVWSLDRAGAYPPTTPPIRPLTRLPAHVTNGVLVADLPGSAAFQLAGTSITATGTHLVARIKHLDDGRYTLDGFITGRVPADDFIKSVANVKLTVNTVSVTFCDAPQFEAFRIQACSGLDIRATDDNPDLPCNAMSAVFGIHAVSTLVDPIVRDGQAPPASCTRAVRTCP